MYFHGLIWFYSSFAPVHDTHNHGVSGIIHGIFYAHTYRDEKPEKSYNLNKAEDDENGRKTMEKSERQTAKFLKIIHGSYMGRQTQLWKKLRKAM